MCLGTVVYRMKAVCDQSKALCRMDDGMAHMFWPMRILGYLVPHANEIEITNCDRRGWHQIGLSDMRRHSLDDVPPAGVLFFISLYTCEICRGDYWALAIFLSFLSSISSTEVWCFCSDAVFP